MHKVLERLLSKKSMRNLTVLSSFALSVGAYAPWDDLAAK